MKGIVQTSLPYVVKLSGSDPEIYSAIRAAFFRQDEAFAFAENLHIERGMPVRVLDTRMTTGSLVIRRYPMTIGESK